MSVRTAQAVLFLCLLLALAVTVFALWQGYSRREYFAEDLQTLIAQVLAQFSGPLSVVAGSFFALRGVSRRTPVAHASFWLALACVTLWSVLIAGRAAAFIAYSNEAPVVMTNWLTQVVTAASFLLTGALTYFFASPRAATKSSTSRKMAERRRSTSTLTPDSLSERTVNRTTD